MVRREEIHSELNKEKEEIAENYREERRRKRIVAKARVYIVVLTFYLVFKFVLLNGYIPSASMDPTVKVGDLILVDRLHYTLNDYKRQDVIVFNFDNSYTIKRIIGLEGDKVVIKDGVVYVNGVKLEEPYLKDKNSTFIRDNSKNAPDGPFEFIVPENNLFLLGDNRENSYDSRYWDEPFISHDEVIGKLIFKYKLPVISKKISEEMGG